VESGNLTNTPSRIDFTEVINDAVNISVDPESKPRVKINIESALPQVFADSAKLTQVFANLIGNAIKYSPGGGDVNVTVRFRPERNGVVVSVRDHGIGMTIEDMSNLFKKFYRAKDKSIANIPGNGLGLYIVKSFVTLMGGEIWVESELGKGSTFHVMIPAARPESKSTDGGLKQKPAPG